MACGKHKQRKRPSSCNACKAELEQKDITKLGIKEHINTNLVNIDKAEEVINSIKEKKKREDKIQEDKIEIISTPTGENEFYKEFIKSYINESLSQIPEDIKSSIDLYFEERLKKIKQEINSITTVKYEYKFVHEASFRISDLDTEAKNGWRFKEILRGDIIKTYGLKEPSVLFERIKQ